MADQGLTFRAMHFLQRQSLHSAVQFCSIVSPRAQRGVHNYYKREAGEGRVVRAPLARHPPTPPPASFPEPRLGQSHGPGAGPGVSEMLGATKATHCTPAPVPAQDGAKHHLRTSRRNAC